MNKRTAILSIMIAIAVFSFILFALSYGKEGISATVTVQQIDETPTLAAQSTPIPSISRTTLQKYASADIETQIINGIEMSASNFRIEDNLLKVNICFAAPDNRHWTIGEGFMQIGDNKLLLLESQNLETSRTLDNGTGQVTDRKSTRLNSSH